MGKAAVLCCAAVLYLQNQVTCADIVGIFDSIMFV